MACWSSLILGLCTAVEAEALVDRADKRLPVKKERIYANVGSAAVGRVSKAANPLDAPQSRAVLWCVSGNQRDVLKSLTSSIACFHASRQSQPLVLLVLLWRSDFSCAHLGLSGENCTKLAKPRSWARGCEAGPPRLYGHHVYLLDADGADAADKARLARFAEYASAWGMGRSDLTASTAVWGANLRFMADRMVLPFGVRRALYLDADVCVCGDVAPLFLANSSAALVVAERAKQGGSWIHAESAMLPILRRQWGFDKAQHQFKQRGDAHEFSGLLQAGAI